MAILNLTGGNITITALPISGKVLALDSEMTPELIGCSRMRKTLSLESEMTPILRQ